MAYSSGVFSRLYDWTDDRDASVPITASRMDAEMDGMATALSTALLKDGTQTVTANIPFSGFRLTGIGLATARTDAARADQLQDGLIQFATATGTDTYAATLAPAITAYANGQSFRIKFTNGNTGAATLNVNSVGVVDLQKRNGTALVSGDIPANSIFEVTYNSTGPKFIIDREVVAAQPLDTDLTTIAALTVVRGTIMYGNSSPAWAALALGTAGQGLFSDGTDLAYTKVKALQLAAEAVAGSPLINGKLVASVGSNALTVAIKTLAGTDPSASDPVWIRLPDETIATGAPDVVAITSAQSVVVPDTATMGAANAVAFRLWVVGFNSSGAFTGLGVVNAKGSTSVLHLDEGELVSSTTIGTGADVAQTFYSTTGVTNKPYRILGHLTWETGLTSAGVWDAAPTRVHQFSMGSKRPGDAVRYVRTELPTTLAAQGGTGGTFNAVTGLSVAITPGSAANAIKLEGFGNFTSAAAGCTLGLLVKRATTVIGAGTTAGSRSSVHSAGNMSTAAMTTLPINILDLTPAVGANTYSTEVTMDQNQTWNLNRTNSDTDNSTNFRAMSLIQATEIMA